VSKQRSDLQGVAEHRSQANTTAALTRLLRANGIRNVHTNRKAQAAIARAATMPLSIPAERERGRG
jgi:hypothetical protein